MATINNLVEPSAPAKRALSSGGAQRWLAAGFGFLIVAAQSVERAESAREDLRRRRYGELLSG